MAPDNITVVTAFVSLVVIPFFGVLSEFNTRVSRQLATLVVLWAAVGFVLLAVPLSPLLAPYMSQADRDTYLSSPPVQHGIAIWFFGTCIGAVLVLANVTFEKVSRWKLLNHSWGVVKVVGFLAGLARFLKLYL